MTGRQKFKLNELGSVGRGKSKHRPRNDPILYNGLYPFFQTGDVKEAALFLRKYSQTYSDAGLAQSKLWYPGTLCITIAANVADTAILAIPGCFPDSVVGFVADPLKADARFVKYYIDTIKRQMVSASKGTTQDNLSLDKLLTFEFEVPSVDEQSRIANVLSSYDTLIENNNRRVEILEEMSRQIYEEWFVKFQFQGHKQVPLFESELGLIPEGWRVDTLDKAVVLQRGFDLPSGSRDDGMFPIIAASGVAGYHSEKKVNAPGVVTGRSGTIGKVMYISEDFWPLNTALWVKEFVSVSPLFAFHLLSRIDFSSVAGGAAVPTLNRNHVHAMKVVIPAEYVIEAFDTAVMPLRKLVRNLELKNIRLREIRNLLLPKLISGELDVSKLPTQDEVAA